MNKHENLWTNPSIGLLVIRIALGGILFFHGFHKIGHGIEGQSQLLASNGIPGFFMYFGYVSQVLAPILIVLGVLTRISSLTIIITMVVIFIVLPFPVGLDDHGALNIESQLFFLLLAVALFFTGPGRYRLRKAEGGHWLLD